MEGYLVMAVSNEEKMALWPPVVPFVIFTEYYGTKHIFRVAYGLRERSFNLEVGETIHQPDWVAMKHVEAIRLY